MTQLFHNIKKHFTILLKSPRYHYDPSTSLDNEQKETFPFFLYLLFRWWEYVKFLHHVFLYYMFIYTRCCLFYIFSFFEIWMLKSSQRVHKIAGSWQWKPKAPFTIYWENIRAYKYTNKNTPKNIFEMLARCVRNTSKLLWLLSHIYTNFPEPLRL